MSKSIVQAIEQYESLAETHGELSRERSLALDYYLGNPLGNEVEGRSQVVSRDVWDTLEWIKPQLADIFCGGDDVINFTPQGPEDVKAAEQETEYVNHTITQKNPWFEIWYAWMHDALLQKVGYVKPYWDESEDVTEEQYKGLTEDELVLLLQDEEVEVSEGEQTAEGFNVKLKKTKRYGCAKMVNVAPENVRVDANAANLSLQDPRCNFAEHFEKKTISQLRMDGFDVPDDISDSGTVANGWEDDRRDDAGNIDPDSSEATDPSMRKVTVRECWIRHDDDEDGKAELLHIIIVGTTVLLKEPAPAIQLVALCPTPLPHQHAGLSVADAVKDLQLIKTALLRGGLDNQYLANNGRHAVDATTVNLDDMLVSRPGGIVRVQGDPRAAIVPLNHSTTGDQAVGMMEYIDRVAQKRTGVNEQSQGLDPNVLQTATHSAQIATAAMQRIKFIARIFAETGVKSLFQLVHMLTLTHSRKAEMIRLRNQWVPVDPRQWKKRADMQISVGLGAGDKMQQLVFLEKLLEKQVMAVQVGLSSPPKVYNALKRYTQAAGFKDATEFWDDPTTTPPKPPQTPPEVQAEQAKGQVLMALEDKKAQTAIQVEQQRGQIKLQELQASLQLQASNDDRDAQREQMRAVMDAQLEQEKQRLTVWMEQAQMNLDKYKTDQDNQVKLMIAGLQAKQKAEEGQRDRTHDVHMDARQSHHQAQMTERQHMHSLEEQETAAVLNKHAEKRNG
jgi:hypothetical protein